MRFPIATSRIDDFGGLPTARSLRVLHIAKRFWPFLGGVERYVQDVAHGQVEQGHTVTILTIDRDLVGGSKLRLPSKEHHLGIRVRRVPARGNSRKQVAVGDIRTIIREIGAADVVHHHDPRFLFETAIAIRRLVRRPLILHTHGFIWHTSDYARLKRVALRCYYGPLMRTLVDAIVASSAADARRLEDTAGVSGARVHLIPNAIDLSRYRNIRRRPEPGFVLVFGRIDAHKGLDRLIAALPLVTQPWRLFVAGTGPEDFVDDLRLQASRLGIGGRLTWLGQVDDDELDKLLSRAALAVFPSRFEGFGIALLESLAAGVPSLASDIEAHREVVGPDLASCLVSMDGPASIAAAIDSALHPSPAIAAAAADASRARAQNFDVGVLVQLIDAIYDQLGLAHHDVKES